MSKKKYLLLCLLQTLIAAIYPFVYMVTWKYKNYSYDSMPYLVLTCLFPLIMGAILYLNKIVSIDKTVSAIFLVLNLFMVIITWEVIPGTVATYNLLICGVLLISIFDKYTDKR